MTTWNPTPGSTRAPRPMQASEPQPAGPSKLTPEETTTLRSIGEILEVMRVVGTCELSVLEHQITRLRWVHNAVLERMLR